VSRPPRLWNSRQATQRLFHSLGGRLTERSGNDLTVFFPVAPG